MEPGWFVLVLGLLFECILVSLLILPMPSNDVRGMLTMAVTRLYWKKEVRYVLYGIMGLNLFYFYFLVEALLHPLYDLGFITPVEMSPTCEVKMDMFRNERNVYITGFSLFMFLVLRRLIDIQTQLYRARSSEKRSSGDVPMGDPVIPMGKPVKAD